MAEERMEPGNAELAGRVLDSATDRVSALQVRLRDVNWGGLSRMGFLKQAEQCLDMLTGIRKSMEDLHYYLKENEELEFEFIISEFKKLEGVLEKNIELEDRKESSGIKEIQLQMKEEHPELFASLQQSLLSHLMKARFLLERVSLHLQKAMPSEEEKGKAAEKNELVSLLEQKERELQELHLRFDSVRKHAVLGFAHEESAAELEHELQKAGNAFERERASFGMLLGNFKSTVSGLQMSFLELADKMEEIEKLYSDFSEKSSELTMLLKKDRDFAKKTLLDVENEVLQLRATYSREIMRFEEGKAAARESAVADTKKSIERLQNELEEKEELIMQFRDIAQRKEKENLELKEKLSYMGAASKAREMDKEKKKGGKKGQKKEK
ncbi:MAG: hypothetical protein NT067_04290 [Candidatus Diapherotrites archaeon]|nr:hypothetical protein [Candidatus Diapherotrites archaeon]